MVGSMMRRSVRKCVISWLMILCVLAATLPVPAHALAPKSSLQDDKDRRDLREVMEQKTRGTGLLGEPGAGDRRYKSGGEEVKRWRVEQEERRIKGGNEGVTEMGQPVISDFSRKDGYVFLDTVVRGQRTVIRIDEDLFGLIYRADRSLSKDTSVPPEANLLIMSESQKGRLDWSASGMAYDFLRPYLVRAKLLEEKDKWPSHRYLLILPSKYSTICLAFSQ